MNLLIFPDLMKKHVTAFFTGKIPGADLPQISKILNVDTGKIYMPIQKHTDKIAVVESAFQSVIADAVITKEHGILIGVQVADCVPILLYETTKGIMAAVHAGWRGTAESILKKTIKMVTDRYICSEENIYIALGPAIRGCCYHVDFDVMHAVSRVTGPGDYVVNKAGKYCLDLPGANKYQALSMGVPEKNIWLSEDCTFCRPDLYYSYRFAKGTTGRQGAFIGKM
jgi:polyphenol oxidase